jgi:hypothetical protein
VETAMLFVLALETLKLMRGTLLTVSLVAVMVVATLMLFAPITAIFLRIH